MEDRDRSPMDRASYERLSSQALRELLRRDLKENFLDVETVCAVASILKERKEREDPDSIPPIDLRWRSFRENVLSFKAQLRRFARRVLPKFLIVLGIIAAVVVIVWLNNLPHFTASLTDTVTLEDGRFAVDGFTAGATEENVIAWLEEHDVPYSGNDMDYYLNLYRRNPSFSISDFSRYPVNESWINIEGNIRIEELGRIPLHCTYHFERGLLTSVELSAETIRGNIPRHVQGFRNLVLAAESAFGAPSGIGDASWSPHDFSAPGSDQMFWYGADGSTLEFFGRWYQLPGAASGVFSKDPRAGKLVDYFELRISITL